MSDLLSSLQAQQVVSPNALTQVEQQRAVSETQSKIFLAKQFPRNQAESLSNIIQACQRVSLAEKSMYSYQRGGTDITGPSIRLAEAIAQNWGNMQFGIKELEQKNGESLVLAYAWDMQTNVVQDKTFAVPHKRTTKKGTYKLEDPRDIYEMVANQGARRMRSCILALIPGDIVEESIKECTKTLVSKMEKESGKTEERIKKCLEEFSKFNVSKEQLEKYVQRNLEAATPTQFVQLGTILNSLKDGISSASGWFEMTENNSEKSSTEQLKEKLKEA